MLSVTPSFQENRRDRHLSGRPPQVLRPFYQVDDVPQSSGFTCCAVAPETLMRAVGVIEMIVGIAILTRWTRLGAYVAAAWLVCIALVLAGLLLQHSMSVSASDYH